MRGRRSGAARRLLGVVLSSGVAGCLIGPGTLEPLTPGLNPVREDYERDFVCEECTAVWSEGKEGPIPGGSLHLRVATLPRTGLVFVSLRLADVTVAPQWLRGRIDIEGASDVLRYRDFFRSVDFGSSGLDATLAVRPVFSSRVSFVVGIPAASSMQRTEATLFTLVFELVGPGEATISLRGLSYELSGGSVIRAPEGTVADGRLHVTR